MDSCGSNFGIKLSLEFYNAAIKIKKKEGISNMSCKTIIAPKHGKFEGSFAI